MAAALALFDTVRTRLADELGVDPGPAVQSALQTVLHQVLPPEPRSPGPAPDTNEEPERATVPAQLPPNTRGFVGRSAELAALEAILSATGEQATTVAISAVSVTGQGR